MKRSYLECVLPEVEGRFHYHLPESLLGRVIEPGARLLVPFGNGWKVSYFIRSIKNPDVPKTKSVLALLDPVSLFNPTLIKLLFWISEYYQTALGGVMKTALPKGIHVVPRRRFSLSGQANEKPWEGRSALQGSLIHLLASKGETEEKQIRKALHHKGLSRAFYNLKKKGFIIEKWDISPPPVRKKAEKVTQLKISQGEALVMSESIRKSAPSQSRIIEELVSLGGEQPLAFFDIPSRAVIRRLVQKGVLYLREEVVLRRPGQGRGFCSKGEIKLNPDQAAVVKEVKETIQCGLFAPFLLHGVTGSGKTEVYLRAIEAVLARGDGAILLLPEIGLTTHIAARFQDWFGDQVALLHSGLSAGERYDEWRRVKEGKAPLVIGARSAIFAPLASVGIIIVDEEHDASYRQGEGSRYNGRDVALVRGRDEKAVVLLGSATPSFETYYNAMQGKYRYLHLPTRIDGRFLPTVSLVNLKEKEEWVRPFFTKRLYRAIKKRITEKEQTLLFVNRRGFAPFLLCHDCGYTPLCHHCTVSLTFHKKFKQLICHYCAYQMTPPTTCPECRGVNLGYMGIGTEQIEENIRLLFPEARVARLDRDTTQKKGAYEQILSAMAREEIDILIGTQMIAKGHDFPKVTLVGVLSADLSLHVPDFRSSERTFQLLAQVAGRSGRGERPGEVIVQTFQTENQVIQAAASHDYLVFYESEIVPRKERDYPPYARITLLLLRHKREEAAASAAAELTSFINKSAYGKGIKVLGPAPAPLLRVREEYRYQILLKGRDQRQIALVLKSALNSWKRSSEKNVRLDIEVDPQQFV